MTDRPRRCVWPLLAAALIGLPVLYVLSVGPVYLLVFYGCFDDYIGESAFPAIRIYFWPLRASREYGPDWWGHLIDAYLDHWLWISSSA